MAGLYDDLPEPQGVVAAVPAAVGDGLPAGGGFGRQGVPALGPRPEAPAAAASRFFRLDDASVGHVLAFLSLREVGASLPRACQLLHWLREAWGPWQAAVAPLCRRVELQVVRLLSAEAQSVERFAKLALAAEAAVAHGFGDVGRHSRLLGGVGGYRFYYGGLPLQSVQWSLHSEGMTPWRSSCSMALDASFAALPPWSSASRKARLPRPLRLLVGISLWLPPEGVDAAHSFPLLYLNMALDEPHAQALATLARQPGSTEPPCIALNCEAVLFSPGSSGNGLLEEWSLRACFGPEGYRHAGHGETDGYRAEAMAAGRRRWRPLEPCFAPAGAAGLSDQGLHLLLRCRRCDGLLD